MQRIMRLGLPIVAIFAVVFISCAPKKVGSPTRVLIPWPTGQKKYSLQTVELSTITNINKIEGTSAEFIENPNLNQNTISGAPVDGDFFSNSNGVFVPKDFKSLNLITVYAHIEKLNLFMDQIGYSSLLPRPRKVAVGLRTSIVELPKTNNAIYIGPFDTLVILPYEAEGLPISMNAGILAHEYFHGIFHSILLKEFLESPAHSAPFQQEEACDPEKPKDLSNRELNEFVLSGLNEGLADLWAWIYTGDPAFMSHSLGGQNYRKLDTVMRRLPRTKDLRTVFRTHLLKDCDRRQTYKYMRAISYSWGASIAQFFVKLLDSDFKKVGLEHRKLLAEKIIRALKKLPEAVEKQENANKPISLNLFFQQYFLANDKATTSACELLNTVMAKEEVESEDANKVNGCP